MDRIIPCRCPHAGSSTCPGCRNDFDYELQRYLMHQKLEREEQPVGTYAVSCWGFASRGQDHADCLRLNTKTGEMSLVNAHTISGSNHE